jgi:protein-disulfide isomerase
MLFWPDVAIAQPGLTTQGPETTIELDPRMSAGQANAPVVLVLYACGRSELCAELIPKLYREVVGGRLKGKVRLYLRPYFPTEADDRAACGRAFYAAADQGMFWPYLLHVFAHQDDFKLCLLTKWALLKGLDKDAFEIEYASARTTERLAAARREAMMNHVDKVPCAYVNGRKVERQLSADQLVELLEKAFEQASP